MRWIWSILTLSGLSRRCQTAICLCLGFAIGLAVVVARLANAMSYLSDAPQTCMNCHIMTDAYATWQRGSHGQVTICLDCHVPHSNIVAKTAFKGMDGMKHSSVFLMRREPQVLQLSQAAIKVVQANCIRCHGEQLTMIRLAGSAERTCWDCHDTVHGQVRSLSASPHVLRPQLPDAGLTWLKQSGKEIEHDQ